MSSPDDITDEADAMERRIANGGDAVAGFLGWLRSFAGNAAGAATTIAVGDPILGLVAGAAVSATVDSTASAAQRFRKELDDRAAADAIENLSPRSDEIRENVLALRVASDGQAGTTADVAAIVQMFVEAWTRASDHRARRMIENAAVNAFDPKRYEEGLTRTLFAILSRIEYGDIETLRSIAKEADGGTARSPTMRGFHLARLIDERLAFSGYPDLSGVRATELGVRLLAFVESQQTRA